ncbi:hypothetical protein MINTMi198_23680 [Mycobacterium intracellulare M.i.198]|nr:hypothetical protein MINTMi198_23680 [Mycobacterium intracellulare M.i.198]
MLAFIPEAMECVERRSRDHTYAAAHLSVLSGEAANTPTLLRSHTPNHLPAQPYWACAGNPTEHTLRAWAFTRRLVYDQ